MSQYRYADPTNQEHVLETSPLTGMGQLLRARDTELFPRSGAKPSKTGRPGSSPPRQQGGHA